MNKPYFIKVAIPTPLRQTFDYLPSDNMTREMLQPGCRVRVSFGKRKVVGVIITLIENSHVPPEKLKKIIEILDEEPIFAPALFKLLNWAANYYHHPIGEVFEAAMPKMLRKVLKAEKLNIPTVRKSKADRKTQEVFSDRRDAASSALTSDSRENIQTLNLNQNQRNALHLIKENIHHFQPFLLLGITGSGKTEIYLQTIQTLIEKNKTALILVPEISLTPQTLTRFQTRFNVPIAILHSSLTDRERLENWELARKGEAKIIIGTRSAIFTPIPHLGLIIIDEEHDTSFKQQEGFKYSARDLALMRASYENIPIILGSATPSLESMINVDRKRFTLLHLPERVGNAIPPSFKLIDLGTQPIEHGLSRALIESIKQHLEKNGQILLFLNRRGFAPVLICRQCNWMAGCSRCDAKLIYHHHPAALCCHHCGYTRTAQTHCPTCESTALFPLGLGTQRLEQTLQKHFPDKTIVRIDKDSTRKKGQLQIMLENVTAEKTDILIGTQILAKGHHFPNVTMVGILEADHGLYSADFRAKERMAQLILQVAGRAGRGEKSGEVFIQTYYPQNTFFQELFQQDYLSLSKNLLKERNEVLFPPATFLALIRAESPQKEMAFAFLTKIKNLTKADTITLLGPAPALIEKKSGRYRAQLLLQSSQRSALHQTLDQILTQIPSLSLSQRVRWTIDVDPQEIF